MSCPEIGLHNLSVKCIIQMNFVRRTFYSLEPKHQICKEHFVNGLSLRDCVEKYNLSFIEKLAPDNYAKLLRDWEKKYPKK